jgi:hypothetical protein
MVARTIHVEATGAAHDAGPGTLYGATLTANGADAQAVIRDGGATGDVLATLAALDGTTAETKIPRHFAAGVHVTLTGEGATCEVFV